MGVKKEVVKAVKPFLKGLGKTVAVAVGVVLASSPSWAYTIPSDGFIYDLYDILVNKMIKGPVGTAAGVAAMVYGGTNLIIGRWTGAILPILGGAMLIKADSIASSVGMTVRNF